MPKTITGILISILLIPVIYILILGIYPSTRDNERFDTLNKVGNRLGPLSKPIQDLLNFWKDL